MSVSGGLIRLAESGWLPDAAIRAGIRRLLRRRLRDETEHQDARRRALLRALRDGPVAPRPELANAQHYEVPAAFFRAVLGPRLKYSACYWPPTVTDLAAAERAMLELYAARTGLEDGMRILDLGCGWGAFALWAARRYPSSRVLAVSNSTAQRTFIEARAREAGLDNLDARTADVNDWMPAERFDRVVCVEMFEHMRNYQALLDRIAGWLAPGGRLFVHLFCHRSLMYRFESAGSDNWMGHLFFSEGLMPARDTLAQFQGRLRLERQWMLDGRHYRKTVRAWLGNLDADPAAATAALAGGGAAGAGVQLQRWRIFFMACEELFGFAGGTEWQVGHYLLAPERAGSGDGV
ncbi:MAG: class I SAM-dependent methyltransferase [Acidobacteria bacterium]|nr:class I SAM-dependent methyltransferase [Acidobacteriota bacterium]